MILVVVMTVRCDAAEAFRSFEHAAARAMEKHGGAIERTVVTRPDAGGAFFKEVHLVRFPSDEAFAAYRADSELQAVRHLRDASVVDTQILVGEPGPDYGDPG